MNHTGLEHNVLYLSDETIPDNVGALAVTKINI